jgi:hypothetical protein
MPLVFSTILVYDDAENKVQTHSAALRKKWNNLAKHCYDS